MSDEPLFRQVVAPLGVTAAVSSLAGLAATLRARGRVSARQVVAAMITSAVTGVIVGALLWTRLSDDHMTLVGVSSLAGAGGASTLDMLLQHLRARAGHGDTR